MERTTAPRHPDDEDLQALLWNELDETRAAGVRAHLESCAACRESYAELQEFAAVEGPPDDPAERAAGRLMAETVLTQARLERWRATAAALAASLVLATAGGTTFFAHREYSATSTANGPRVEVREGVRAPTQLELRAEDRLIELAVFPKVVDTQARYSLDVRDGDNRSVAMLEDLVLRDRHLEIPLPSGPFQRGGLFELSLWVVDKGQRSQAATLGLEVILR